MAIFSSPREILRALWRKSWLILLILAVGLPASIWFALQQDRVYQATAVIQIEAPEVMETSAGGTTNRAVTADSQLDLIQQKLTARDSMQALVDRFDLFAEAESDALKVAFLREALQIVKLIDPAQAWRPDVQPLGLSITVRLGDPQDSADVANALLDAILVESQRRADSRTARTLEFFEREAARLEADIVALEARIARYQEANADALPAAIATGRGQLTTLAEGQLALDQQIVALETGSDRLREEERTRQIALLNEQRAILGESIAELRDAIARAPEVERQLSTFERDLAQLETQFEIVSERRTEAAMAQLIEVQDQAERFEVLERAILPELPISTSRRKLAMAGGVAVGLLALVAALGLEALRPALRTRAQVTKELGVEPVITIPRLRRKSRTVLWLGAVLAALGGAIAIFWEPLRDMIGRLPGLNLRGGRSGGTVPAE